MRRKYHFIYKTTNVLNKHFYYGVHSTFNLNDGYLGSGTKLKQAIKEYGKNNFYREIIEYFDNDDDAYKRESEIVNQEMLLNELCYNMNVGGARPPVKHGSDHPSTGIINKGARKWWRENNPSKGKTGKKSLSYNKVSVRDKDGNTFQVSKDDPRYISGELVHINRCRVRVRDKDGNTFQVSKDDPRYISGELVPSSRGEKLGFIWIKNKTDSKLIPPDQLDMHINNGWKLGRVKESKYKISYDNKVYSANQLAEMFNTHPTNIRRWAKSSKKGFRLI